MASTLTRQFSGGATRPTFSKGDRTIQMAAYKLAMGNPYVVGGEDISAIWTDFSEVLAIMVQQAEVTAADRRAFMVDLTNKKLLQYDAFNTEETATDQTAVADIRLLVFGYR